MTGNHHNTGHEQRPADQPPALPDGGPHIAGMPVAFAARMLRELTLQNVLMLTILLVVGMPSYFAYRFMADTAFRHEFMRTSEIVDAQVPCLVVRGNLFGSDRYSIGSSYKIEDRMEYLITIRSPGIIGDREVAELCDKARGEAQFMLKSIREQVEQDQREQQQQRKRP